MVIVNKNMNTCTSIRLPCGGYKFIERWQLRIVLEILNMSHDLDLLMKMAILHYILHTTSRTLIYLLRHQKQNIRTAAYLLVHGKFYFLSKIFSEILKTLNFESCKIFEEV